MFPSTYVYGSGISQTQVACADSMYILCTNLPVGASLEPLVVSLCLSK